MTTDDWDPNTPLTWDELEPEPFAVDDQPVAEAGGYTMTARLPQKSGQHLIYTIWQRTDSPEAFYSCSDVTFGGEGDEVTTAAEETEAFTVDPAAQEEMDHAHADHAAQAPAEEEVQGDESEAVEEPAEEKADEPEEAPAADHGAHASGGSELAETGTAITGLFVTAIALMAAGAGALHLARKRRGVV